MRTTCALSLILAGLLALVAMGPPAALAADNLAPDPGFEEDANGDGEPDGWWKWGGPGDKAPTNLRRVTDEPHGGEYCAQVGDSATTGNFYVASQYTPVEGGKPYVLHVWARGGEGQSGAIRLDELDGDRKYLGATATAIRFTDQWREHRVVATRLRDETRFAQISLQPAVGQWADTGVAWFDDVRLERADDLITDVVVEPGGEDWFPFPLDWRDGGPSPLDVTAYLPVEKTGAHGFLTARDGHFVFQDGTRARFWATNIHSSRAAYPTHEEAQSFARRLARLGVNTVRVHLLEYESPGGLVDASGDTTDQFDPERLERFDYLMAQFHENGIYVILDALPMCARVFREGDGVKAYQELGRGAKGASLFDERIIELEHSYARRLLLHENPHRNGLRYVDDPTVALYEMSNEDALLLWWSWSQLPQVYRDDLRARWNQWLVNRFRDREGLAARWTAGDGVVGLADDEDPAAGTVRLDPAAPEHVVRRVDVHRFLADVQADYYRAQVRFLRELGVRVPLSGSNIMAQPAMMASSEPLDYTDTHAYWDHPRYESGTEKWLRNEPMLKADPLSTPVLPTQLATAKQAGKPAVATEWNSLWPNQWRAADTVMTPAYALLNDLDIIYIYCYLGGWGISHEQARPKIHHATVIFSDPAQTGLFPLLALMYRRGDVRAGRSLVERGLSPTDTYLASTMFTTAGDFQHFVPLLCRWQQQPFEGDYRASPGVDLTVSSGFSATGDYGPPRRLLLWSVADWGADGRAHTPLQAAQLLDPSFALLDPGQEDVELAGDLPAGEQLRVRLPRSTCLDAGALRESWTAWLTGTAGDKTACLGAERQARAWQASVAPGAGAALGQARDLLARWFTDAGRRWGLLEDDQGYNPVTGEFVSDTGELRWRPREGVWTCVAERVNVVAGFLPQGQPVQAGALRVTPRTDFGTYCLVSLEEAPLGTSRHCLLVAVGRAENTGQKLRQTVFQEPGAPPEVTGPVEVLSVGDEPVLVQGLRAEVSIAAGPGHWRCWALDPAGRRLRQVSVKALDGGLGLTLGPEWKTIYYELAVE